MGTELILFIVNFRNSEHRIPFKRSYVIVISKYVTVSQREKMRGKKYFTMMEKAEMMDEMAQRVASGCSIRSYCREKVIQPSQMRRWLKIGKR